MGVGDDLLLFRAVEEPARQSVAVRRLGEGMDRRGWRALAAADLWELSDASHGCDEEPVALAATCPLDEGSQVQLLAVVVETSRRGRGIGRRIIEELSDALRARGVMVLVAGVPSGWTSAIAVVQRAGLRPSRVAHANPGDLGHDLVWFDLEL